MRKLIITAIILTISFSVDAQSWWSNKKVKGNGELKTETRKTEDYDGVSLGGFFEIVLIKGKEGNIKVEAEENLLQYIVTEVKRGTLQVNVEKGYNLKTTRRITVTVPVQEIEKVSLGGSGNIKGDLLLKADEFSVSIGGSGNIGLNIDAENVKTSVAGSGDIELSGKASSIKCSIAGSGTIKAYDLEVDSVKASIAGSGDIRISVKNSIKATVAGSGNIYYKGNPSTKDVKSVGSGRIVNKN